MKKGLVVISLVAMVLLGVVCAQAYGPGDGPRWKADPRWDCWKSPGIGKGLNLTPEQKAKLDDLRQKFVAETAKLRGEILTKRLELQSLWANPKADPKAIVEKEKELRELQAQMREKGLHHRLEVRQILTPEQIAGSGPGRGFGPGYGPMKGYGMGRGFCPGRGPCF